MEMQVPDQPRLQTVTRAALDRLLNDLTPLKLAFDQANQGGQQGGWKRSAPSEVSVPYQRKLREIEDQIRVDIDAVDRLCTAHAAFVQDLLDRAKAYMVSTKKAVQITEDDPDESNLTQAARVAASAAVALEQIATNAAEADSAYGQAWFAYRGNLGLPDENINKDYFEDQRKGIMARGKVITAKVAKCAQLHDQAKAYQTLSAKLLQKAKGLKIDKAEIKRTAIELEAKLRGLLATGIDDRPRMGWQGDGRNWTSKVKALEVMARGKITKKTQTEAVSWMADLEATLKIFRNQVKTMETVLMAAKKPLTPDKIKKEKKLFEQAEAHVNRAREIYSDAAEKVKLAQRQLDIIKRADV